MRPVPPGGVGGRAGVAPSLPRVSLPTPGVRPAPASTSATSSEPEPGAAAGGVRGESGSPGGSVGGSAGGGAGGSVGGPGGSVAALAVPAPDAEGVAEALPGLLSVATGRQLFKPHTQVCVRGGGRGGACGQAESCHASVLPECGVSSVVRVWISCAVCVVYVWFVCGVCAFYVWSMCVWVSTNPFCGTAGGAAVHCCRRAVFCCAPCRVTHCAVLESLLRVAFHCVLLGPARADGRCAAAAAVPVRVPGRLSAVVPHPAVTSVGQSGVRHVCF
jgi:hypothetical protein